MGRITCSTTRGGSVWRRRWGRASGVLLFAERTAAGDDDPEQRRHVEREVGEWAAGGECVLWGKADSVERAAGGDGSAGECACELERGADGVKGVWRRVDVDCGWPGEVRDILPGWVGDGLRGSAILRDGGGVLECGP